MKHSDKWIKKYGINKLHKQGMNKKVMEYHEDKILEILDVKNKNKRIALIYDLLCEYLDNIFICEHACGFKDGICLKRQHLIDIGKEHNTYVNGCCHSYLKGDDCEHLGKNGCKIKNVACKLFTCQYLQKQDIKYSINKIFFSKYFLTLRQKNILSNTYFIPKEEVLEKLGIKKDLQM